MWRYTISGIPATKFRTVDKARGWDDYASARLHAESELLDQRGSLLPHTGLLSISYCFYLPPLPQYTPCPYAITKPKLLLMQNFVELMLEEFLLDKQAMIVSSTTKKLFDKNPKTLIIIEQIDYGKKTQS